MACLGPFEHHPHLVVGCSGGPDSLALTFLLDQWCVSRGGRVTAVIVDHQLRNDSTVEANQVHALLTARGITAVIRSWDHGPITSDVQNQARLARRQLLIDETIRQNALHLALGHQLDDQVETIIMRAERDTGWRGWAAMNPMVESAAVRLLRPLLSVEKSRLSATCRAHDLIWIDDPGNFSSHFRRGAIRQRADDVDTDACLALMRGAVDYRREQDRALAEIAASFLRVNDGGLWLVDPAILSASPLAMIDWLPRVLAAASGADYPPGASRLLPHLKSIENLLKGRGNGLTVAGAMLSPGRKKSGGGIMVFREPAGCAGPIPAHHGGVVWDGRFWLDCHGLAGQPAIWRALGPTGLRQIKDKLSPLMAAQPAAFLWGQPALWQGGAVVLAPSLEVVQNAQVRGICRYQPRCSLLSAAFMVGE